MLSLESETVAQGSNFKKVAAATTVVAALAIAGVVVSTQSSIKSASKLALITIPEDFSGTLKVDSVVGGSKTVGKFHKFEHEDGDWQIDGVFTTSGDNYDFDITYTLKDDIMVVTHTNSSTGEFIEAECGRDAAFTPYGEGKDILKAAVLINSEELHETSTELAKKHCPEGSELMVLNENGVAWMACGEMSNKGISATFFTRDHTMKVNSVEDMVVDVQHPAEFDLEANNCTVAQNPATHFINQVVQGVDYEHRATAVDRSSVNETSEGRWPFAKEQEARVLWGGSPPSRQCAIFHGLANAGMNYSDHNKWGYYPEARPGFNVGSGNNASYSSYLCEYSSCTVGVDRGSTYGSKNFHFTSIKRCSWAVFADLDTQIRPFFDNGTGNEYEKILSNLNQSKQIRVMTHSMAGLIVQYHLTWGRIKRAHGTTTSGGFYWFQVQNPWYGSNSANQGVLACNLAWGTGALSRALMKAEVCIKEGRLPGKSGSRAVPLPATKKIVYGWPYRYDRYGGLQNSKANGGSKRYNLRMCGMYPTGLSTRFEQFGAFKMIAKFLEHIRSGASVASRTNISWGYIVTGRGRYYNAVWNDGAVDATNCFRGLNFGSSKYSSRMRYTATNHDSGTCRAGKGFVSYNDSCRWWETAASSTTNWL